MRPLLLPLLKSMASGLVLATNMCTAVAQTPGEYLTEYGWGRLVVNSSESSTQSFSLTAIGANKHSCSVEGQITNRVSRITSSPDEPVCAITFLPIDGGVSVRSPGCRQFCGTRAGFEGDYFFAKPECRLQAKREAQEVYLKNYQAGRFGEAIRSLLPVLDKCMKSLGEVESAGLRNNLASAYFQLGNRDACMEMIKPVLDSLTDSYLSQLRQRAPSDYEEWMQILNPIAANQARCSALPR